MSSAELDDIVVSMEGALRRAYALGRQDAIDQLTRYLKSDEVVSQRLALAAPESNTPAIDEAEPALPEVGDQHLVEAAEEERQDSELVSRPRSTEKILIPDRPERSGFVESIRDFVYPSRID